MKSIKYFLVLILVSSITFSCDDDLNITPEDDQTTLSEDLFANESAYKEVLAGVYANLSLTGVDGAGSSNIDGLDAGTSQYGRVLLYLQTLSADQMIWSYENDPGTREIQRNIWTAQNPLILGMFGRAHVSIAFANNFLRETTAEKLDARNVSASTRADIVNFRAEARLLRALSYYHMLDLFGKAARVTEDDPVSNFFPPQIEGVELYQFIVDEITAALPDLIDARQNEHARADKAVAWMILAKLYLNSEIYTGTARYAEALAECEKIIASGYSLTPDYLDLFKADNDVNDASSEIIFPFISDGLNTQNFGPTTVMINGSVGSLEQNGAEVGVGAGGWGGALRVRKQFADLFAGGQFSTDERNTIISAGRPIDIIDIADRDTGYIIQKYSNATSTGGFGPDQTFVNTDLPVFRLGDVYLMYAEAHLRGGGGSSTLAVQYVNDLRTRANNPNLINATTLTLDFILDERSRELHWEAHRRQDLIRYGRFTGGAYNWVWKGNGTNGIALPTHLAKYPIPETSLASNPNLTQNTGY